MKSRKLLAIPGIFLAMTALAAGNHASNHGEAEDVGQPGTASNVTRTVNVDMTDDMRFDTPKIAVKEGETLRFIIRNSGKIKHEMVLGNITELKEHYEMMGTNPEMEHADDNMVTVAPGKRGEIIWQFTKAGKVDFACLQPGHYEAGMKGIIQVSSKESTERK